MDVASLRAAQHRSTKFMAVRVGNVLGSSGSVIRKFKGVAKHPDAVQ